MRGWLWFAVCSLFGFFVLQPVGWLLVGAACYKRAWKLVPGKRSIKPIIGRKWVDEWRWQWMNLLWGNPEDGVSGGDAFGPSWSGEYNPALSRWRAFKWAALRNWANGYNYITWRDSWGTPPLLIKQYTLPILGTRQLKLGWQQLPASDGWIGPYKQRMVFSI